MQSNNTTMINRESSEIITKSTKKEQSFCEQEHSVRDWTNCQRCGRPVCTECSSDNTQVIALKLTLPITCCKRCIATFNDISNLAATVTTTNSQIPSRLLTEAALDSIDSLTYFGVGDKKTNVARAGI